MITLLSQVQATEVFYPSSDGVPWAETSGQIDAIINIVVALRQHFAEQAIVLADQFLYYTQGFPRLCVAPDVMVVFGVAPGPRDNDKTWVEGQKPAVIFEYWQFDPKGEWIPEVRLAPFTAKIMTLNCWPPMN